MLLGEDIIKVLTDSDKAQKFFYNNSSGESNSMITVVKIGGYPPRLLGRIFCLSIRSVSFFSYEILFHNNILFMSICRDS